MLKTIKKLGCLVLGGLIFTVLVVSYTSKTERELLREKAFNEAARQSIREEAFNKAMKDMPENQKENSIKESVDEVKNTRVDIDEEK